MTKVNLIDLNVFVIHLDREITREPIINDLKSIFPKLEIFSAIDKETLSWNKWKNLKKFHRLPTHTNKGVIMGEVALALTYLKLLTHIVNNKIDNVLILEDDAIINPNRKKLPRYLNFIDGLGLYYLGGHVWNNKLWGAFAVIYPNWKITSDMLDELKNPKRFRAWDSMLANYIHNDFMVKGYWDYREKKDKIENLNWMKSYIIPDLSLSSILRDIDK